MPYKLDHNIIARIQQANDIIGVISEHLKLERKGKEFVGLCPFHTDHRPSMYVNPDKQIFKCFACGAGGDVLKFVQMKENLSFIQSIERLAQRAGIELEETRISRKPKTPGQVDIDGNRLSKLNSWALKHWQGNLWDQEKGGQARDYLKKRRISDDSARQWGLGLAIESWDELSKQAGQDNIGERWLIAGGLAVGRDSGGCYDKFRNRLMFPIMDPTGRIVGFGGRTLGDAPAKYMNSPATVLFDKSHTLYGIDQARQAIGDSKTAVLVEGYTDVMMAHQFGVKNVVAALGTSLTAGHARILRRYAKRIVLVFDSDVAGMAAANRALEVCLSEKIDVRLAFVPEGKDPCEFLLEAGKEAFEAVIAHAEDVLSFRWKGFEQQINDSDSLDERGRAIEEFMKIVAATIKAGQSEAIGQSVLIEHISELTGFTAGRIQEILKTLLGKGLRAERRELADPQQQTPTMVQLGRDYYTRAQKEIIELLFSEPGLFLNVEERVVPGMFEQPNLRQIAELLIGDLELGEEPNLTAMLARIEDPVTAGVLTELDIDPKDRIDSLAQLKEAIEAIEEYMSAKEANQIRNSLRDDDTDSLRRISDLLMTQKVNVRKPGLI